MHQSQETARPPRADTPERWQRAADRALAEGIEVRQVADSGAWVATSGRDSAAAYSVGVTGNVAHGCGCLAGANDDPVCKHRAAWYVAIGALTPPPPCLWCNGCGTIPDDYAEAYVTCPDCGGTGRHQPRSLRIIEQHIGLPAA